MPQITEEEALELLHDVDSGYLPIHEMAPFDSIRTWKTGPERIIGGGWWINVFDDAGDWDYISSILSPDGRTSLNYEDIYHGRMPKLAKYKPSAEALKKIWRW